MTRGDSRMRGQRRILVELNTDLSTKGLSALEIQAIVAAWQANAISRDTMTDLIRRGEVPAGGAEERGGIELNAQWRWRIATTERRELLAQHRAVEGASVGGRWINHLKRQRGRIGYEEDRPVPGTKVGGLENRIPLTRNSVEREAKTRGRHPLRLTQSRRGACSSQGEYGLGDDERAAIGGWVIRVIVTRGPDKL